MSRRPCTTRRIDTSLSLTQQTMTYSLTGKLREPTPKIVVARTPQVGMAGKQEKPIGDGINQMVSDCNATALFGDVIPDIIEVGCRLWRYAVRHQRGEDLKNVPSLRMTTMSRDFGLDGRLLSATSVKVGDGYRLALPTGAYYTWKGSI